ncbi:MAG: PepSY-associated TM helix domain-containing protein [Colwellia sp.]
MNWLHTWAGFAVAWLLYFIFVTGSAGYFENEIDRWMKPEITVVNSNDNPDGNTNAYQVLEIAEQQLNQLASDSPQWYIRFPATREPFMGISWLQLADSESKKTKQWRQKSINPENGSAVAIRETGGGHTLYRMHYNLHYIPKIFGYILTSLAGMFMLIGLVTGVVIHKKIFFEFFTFRPQKGMRAWLDIHNVLSVLPLPFHLMITYSGLILLMTVTMSNVIDVTYGEGKANHLKFYKVAHSEIKENKAITLLPEDLSLKTVFDDASTRYKNQKISFIGLIDRGSKNEHYDIFFDHFTGIALASSVEYRIKDHQVEIEISRGKAGSAARVYELFERLHEGLFADIYLRWLYFISGLLGAGMIATGMMLWILKRQKNACKDNKSSRFNIITLIEKINVAVIIGLPIAIAGYFFSNRLLPITMVNRADWEIHCFFISWLACLCFCLFRQSENAWKNMLTIAATSYALLPVVNLITTDHDIISSIQKDDWIMAGFDLSMLLFSAIFTVAVLLINKNRQHKKSINSHLVAEKKSAITSEERPS